MGSQSLVSSSKTKPCQFRSVQLRYAPSACTCDPWLIGALTLYGSELRHIVVAVSIGGSYTAHLVGLYSCMHVAWTAWPCAWCGKTDSWCYNNRFTIHATMNAHAVNWISARVPTWPTALSPPMQYVTHASTLHGISLACKYSYSSQRNSRFHARNSNIM